MIVGICKLDLFIPDSRSLKDKRSVLRKIKDSAQARLKISIAEVGDNDLWQRAQLGFALVGNDRRVIESLIDKTTAFIETRSLAQIIDRAVEIINY